MKLSLSSCLLLFATTAFAQSGATPHIVVIGPMTDSVMFDFEGLQARKFTWPKGCIKTTASQNTQTLRMMCDEIDGTPKTPTKCTVHRCLPNGSGLGGGQISFVIERFTAMHMPALDVEATEAALIGYHFDLSHLTFDGFFSTTKEEKETIKAQKKWLPCNFRVRLGDMPTSRVTKVSAITVELGDEDLDGDGDLDFTIPEEIELTMPYEDAMVIDSKWFKVDNSDSQVLKTLEIEYLDNDGNLIVMTTVPVSIEAMGFADPFLGDIGTPGREISVCFRARGIITKKPGGGSSG